MRKFIFIFTWYENVKYGNPVERKNTISVMNKGDIGATAKAAKAATEVFTRNFGSLRYNTILSIQEIDADGNPVGEPITPQEDSSIIPTGR